MSSVLKRLLWFRDRPVPKTRDHDPDEQFRSLYRGITLRTLARCFVRVPDVFGEALAVTIAADPVEAEPFLPGTWRETDTCPVCGAPTTSADRVPASLEVEYRKGMSLGVSVWAHQDCLERCPDTGVQRSVPW